MINKQFNEERKFGVEIEFVADSQDVRTLCSIMREKGVQAYVEGYNHETKSHWKVVTDSSCGYELVSPPLKGREGFRQLQIACEALKQAGAKVNKSCGLHVHHDIADYKLNDIKNLFATYIKFEKIIDSFVPVSRRANNNRFCKSLATIASEHSTNTEADINKALEKIKRASSIADLRMTLYDRYKKLNFSSYVKYGTVEFRQHSGTIEFDKIYNWVIFTQQMVNNALVRKVDFKYNNNWDKITYFTDVMNMTKAKGASEELQNNLKWLKNRAQELSERQTRVA